MMDPHIAIEASIAHWLLVVRADRRDLLERLRAKFDGTPLVHVLLDRRAGERRRPESPDPGSGGTGNRRRSERRRVAEGRGPSGPGNHRLVQRTAGYDVLEAESRVPVQCPRCDLGLEVEMPRFGELPARLDMAVLHTQSRSHGAKHFVEAEAFRATGRSILACRLLARPRSDQRLIVTVTARGFAITLP